MKAMTHRTTFALDEATARRLRRLSKLWQVSQAEVVRRAVARAEADADVPDGDPVALLEQLHGSGQGLAMEAANGYLAEVREERRQWRER